MGRFVALFGAFCERSVRYLGGVEKARPFRTGDDVQEHGIANAGDQVTDVAGAREFGHGGEVGELTGLPDLGVGFPLLHGLGCRGGKAFFTDRNGQVGHGIDAGVPVHLSEGLASGHGLGHSRVVDHLGDFHPGLQRVIGICRHVCGLRVGWILC